MTEIRRADPAARRRAVLLVVLGALVRSRLERYGPALRQWLLSAPAELAPRFRLTFLLLAAVLSGPLITLAICLWTLGAKVLRAEEFPPPGYRVNRDTPVIRGHSAVMRGRDFKVLALGLGGISALLWLLLWRLARTLSEAAA